MRSTSERHYLGGMLSESLGPDRECGLCAPDGLREFMCNGDPDLPLVLVGLGCLVFTLSSLAPFLCLCDCQLNCTSAVPHTQPIVFLYPYLDKGSWTQLMMIKDMCKK